MDEMRKVTPPPTQVDASQERFNTMMEPIGCGCSVVGLGILLMAVPITLWEHDSYPTIHSASGIVDFLLLRISDMGANEYLLYPSPFALFAVLLPFCAIRFARYIMRERAMTRRADKVVTTRPAWSVMHWATAATIIILIIALAGGEWNAEEVSSSKVWHGWNESDPVISPYPWPLLYELPYGFYTFLHLSVATLGCFSAYRSYADKASPILVLIPVALVLLYQPVVGVELDRETWCWINLFTIPVLVACVMKLGGAASGEQAPTPMMEEQNAPSAPSPSVTASARPDEVILDTPEGKVILDEVVSIMDSPGYRKERYMGRTMDGKKVMVVIRSDGEGHSTVRVLHEWH